MDTIEERADTIEERVDTLEERVEKMISTAVVQCRFAGTPRDQVDDVAQDVRLNMLVKNRDKLAELEAKGILRTVVYRLVRTIQIDRIRKFQSDRARDQHAAQIRGACVSDAIAFASGKEAFAAQSERNQRILQSLSAGMSAAEVGKIENLTPQSVTRIRRKFYEAVLP